MASSIPAYLYACMAPAASSTSVYLAGVPASDEGRLEIYQINLANINSPTATFIANQTSSYYWSSAAPKACLAYNGNKVSTNNPMFIQQFGAKSYFTNFYPNGTIDYPAHFPEIGFISSKLFSLSGSVGNLNWFAAMSNATSSLTRSPWVGLRFNATSIVDSRRDYTLSSYPTLDPMLSVGTYIESSNTPAQGYSIVFDKSGEGVIYTTLATAGLSLTGADSTLALSNPRSVDTDGIALTNSAISLTMTGVGYILDKALDGATVLYSINPSQSNKLQYVSVPGNVPTFSASMVAAAVGSRIITYSAGNNGAVVFNSFDTASGAWSGPGLRKASPPPTRSDTTSPSKPSDGGNTENSSKAPLGAIIGGVVGGLVLIALIAFFAIRRRPKKSTEISANPQPTYHDPNKVQNPAAAPLMEQNYVLQQQQQQAAAQNFQIQQQQQYNLNQPYISQPQPDIYTSQPMAQIPIQQQGGAPVIFQAQTQEPYNYTPPTLIPLPQTQAPNIFQPQASEPSPQTYSQASPYAAPTTASTPLTPASQAYTPTHSGQIPASPQYIAPPGGDQYAS
ncbi:hypothetical protein BX616_002653 [Lobosporangium transversale]|uniref:Uncharacterized protein n=1 Tax=Lobosporangium transversale TaxID=64571 RepID=A0A1Y2GXA4_9FUNG|nr:hypothetical protein BCR41DRAFT_347075 [Lobosporangium transversale]KAF9900216.1 hypothetical protein BX616_002653 [Lobosporangium transversale]ORZ26928.1 hypothetical protein BCR41DRAFT_347075 [Lobosporangium transversale]|eukprot:XP_021884675.1 hypothetical protein BCR41DRAFT_347075 [Lobosporangium transversale]